MKLSFGLGLLALALGLPSAQGVTLAQAFTATGPSDDFCNPGPKATSFLTTDAAVWLYVDIANGVTGDKLAIAWLRPDGGTYGANNFSGLPSNGSYCFDAGINIAGQAAVQYPGLWTVKGTWNGAPLFTITFTLSAAPTGNTLSVLSTSNLFLSGHTGTQGISSPGTAPPFLSVAGSDGKAVRFTSVTGAWACTGSTTSGPDGANCAGGSTNISSYRGIAGLTHSNKTMFLAGVFLDATEPADPSPTRLDVTNFNTTATLQPALRQTFFIGDGLTAASARQEFIVPAGATRLFLGIVDGSAFQGGPCCYDDNSGSMSATYEIVTPTVTPPPPTSGLQISLSPATATSASGGQHTVTATVVNQSGAPQPTIAVKFTILSGPNQGAIGVCGPTSCQTGANGQVTFTYTGAGGAGADSITACINTGATASPSDTCCSEPRSSQVSDLLQSLQPKPQPLFKAANLPRGATKSNNVVIIGGATVDPTCASGANRVGNGGCLPVTGAANELGAFTFSGLAPASVTAAALANYDSVVLNVSASGMSCDMTKLSTQAKADLVAFVAGGKKLIIYDSECKGPGTSGLDYSWLPYPFTTANPGALGAHGTLNIVENSTLGSSIVGSPTYIDAANLSNNTDAVGDMNVMTTKDAHWCLAMSGTNALNVTGPVHAYAKYPAGTDSGLFIYNGLDMDELNNVGNANLRKIWYLELLQAFNPSNLPCGVAVVGITTSVTSSSPAVGSQVTVTARVVDQLGAVQPNVTVSFAITGINSSAAVSCGPSTCKTDSNGQVTFTYTGATAGADSVQACFTPAGGTSAVCAAAIAITWGQGSGGLCATPVTKVWTAPTAVCNYFVQPLTNIAVPAAGTRNGFFQIFTGLQCKWGAVSNDSWITIIAGASGTGSPGAVSYSVAANPTSSPRTGTISITDGAGNVVQTHTVVQLPGGPPCSYGISPLSGGAPAGGGGGAFLLTTGSGCYWIAVPNDPWVHVTPNSGYGSQLLNYTGDANPTTSARSGTIGIMGQTFTVFQGAPAPPVQPGTPQISSGGIVNAASSRGGPLARGSFFTIYGTDIGPTVPSQATSYPIPDTMGGVVVTISQGSVSRRAYLHFVSSTQVNGIIPSNSPLGDVQITVTFNGVVGVSSTATLVDTSFGIFSAASGIGPGIIQNWNSPTDVVLNLPSIPAKPQQLGILWGTGLGPISIPDNSQPPVGDLPAPVIVEVAGLTAQVIYHGRAPNFAGVDNLYFYLPQGVPEGCSVPVRIKAGPSWSNTVRMAVRGGSGACVATPTSTLTTTGGKVGAIVLMRTELNGQFQANQAPVNATLDLGAGIFAEIKAGGQLAFSGVLNLPPAGTCASNTKGISFTSLLGGDIAGGLDTTVNRQLDAGSKVTITSSTKGSVDLNPLGSNAGLYMGLLGGTVPLSGAAQMPLFLEPATTLTVTSSGGKDVGPISGTTTLPAQVFWTNRDQIISVDRATPLTFKWTGGDPARNLLVVGGAADSKTKNNGGFLCLVPAAAGTFTVPVSILADLPTTRPLTGNDDSFGGIGLMMAPVATSPAFSATGLDARTIMTGWASIKTVEIK